jgi:hypothetical protein
MNIFGIGSIVESVGKVADNLFTSDKERLDAQIKKQELVLQDKAIDAQIISKVHETNITEASHKSLFVAGWRPFVGWVCASALAYEFLIYPLFLWLNQIFWQVTPPPHLDTALLVQLLMAMLGMAGIRTYEKRNKIDTTDVKKGKK